MAIWNAKSAERPSVKMRDNLVVIFAAMSVMAALSAFYDGNVNYETY